MWLVALGILAYIIGMYKYSPTTSRLWFLLAFSGFVAVVVGVIELVG